MFARFRRSTLGCRSLPVAVLALFSLLFSLRANALPVHVAVDWPAGMPASRPAHIHIQAVRMATSSSMNNAAPVDADVALNEVSLDLSDGVWQVQAFATGYWSQGAEVVVGRQKSPTR